MMTSIYILDKEVGFIINSINDPSQPDTGMEDGDRKKDVKHQPRKGNYSGKDSRHCINIQ